VKSIAILTTLCSVAREST